jgi:hypothetical protein
MAGIPDVATEFKASLDVGQKRKALRKGVLSAKEPTESKTHQLIFSQRR